MDVDEDFASILRDMIKYFEKTSSTGFTITSGYGFTPPNGYSRSASDPKDLKKYTFKDFNIRYTLDPSTGNLCYVNLTNVPKTYPVRRVFLQNHLEQKKLKIYIDLDTCCIVDYLDLDLKQMPHLESYSLEQEGSVRILILKFKKIK